jgi:hypothetical protein
VSSLVDRYEVGHLGRNRTDLQLSTFMDVVIFVCSRAAHFQRPNWSNLLAIEWAGMKQAGHDAYMQLNG